MEQKFSGRVVLILFVLAVALWAIFPTGNLWRPNLKPGIDMAGGTSLLYQIKEPEGGTPAGENLAIKVMDALKKRVDPQGVRNLIWRPLGNTQLEIQMPNTGRAGEGRAAQDAYLKAQQALNDTNVPPQAVLTAVTTLAGDARREALDRLAGGSDQRSTLFGALASVHDQIQQAKAAKDFKKQADAEQQYDKLRGQLDALNLYPSELELALDAGARTRSAKIDALKVQYAGWTARVNAIDGFVKGYDAYQLVKDKIDSAAELKRLLRGSGVLEFHILVTGADLQSAVSQAMVQRLKARGPASQSGDTMRWYQVDRPEEFKGQSTQTYNDKQWVLAWDSADKSMKHGPGQPKWGLQNAYATTTEKGFAAQRAVGFEFDPVGANLFGTLTTNNTHEPLAIMLDNKVISAPNINEPITGGRGTISGGGSAGFNEDELNYLVKTLSAGSLPAQLADEPIREQTIGPTLGHDNLIRGLVACVAGLAAVGLFMILYYHLSGVVATVALVMNIILTVGVMAMLDATFTLPSIAGLVLTMGVAVDANVLIFERLREEMARGLSLRMAIRNAYDRAFSAIIDSNITTLITCGVLYWFGTEEVKGFGLTLGLGLIASLFTALYVTKTIFMIWIDRFGLKRLGSLPQAWPALGRLLHPNIDWMSKVWYFIGVSATIAVLGMIALVVKFQQGQTLDIEFSSGTSVQFELNHPMDRAAVQKLIDSQPVALPAAMVGAVGNEDLEYSVVTPNASASEVRTAIVSAMGDRLKLERGSSFVGAGEKDVEKVIGQQILPITDTQMAIDGFTPRGVLGNQGGAAIVLRNIEPALSAEQIRTRVQRQMLQPLPDGTQLPFRDVRVESPDGPTTPTHFAILLVSDPNLRYDADESKWRDALVAPLWTVVNEAINNPPTLQRVTTFNASVAGEMRSTALMSMSFSILAIMAYIWLRFGNLRYGAATVVAMLHDTLMVLGFIGLSHYLGQTTIGSWLLIEPFRINMTLVAAILTVMGYSMVDTIVVFDRIRENRGKFGYLSRTIINDSINQTISRTLLTAGTTLLTVFVMYVAGGPAIHGFTFVLLIGILVGTYSSIAIASPILLMGQSETESAKAAPGRLQRVGG